VATYHEPVIGDWYINADGQFIRAWGNIYELGQLNGVILQPLNSPRYSITLEQWQELDLVRYAANQEACGGVRY
jgi:hypothetical protein